MESLLREYEAFCAAETERYGDCTEDTIVGCIAKEYAGKKEGMSVFDPVFVLSAILDWAGIAHNERGYLELTADYRTRVEGR